MVVIIQSLEGLKRTKTDLLRARGDRGSRPVRELGAQARLLPGSPGGRDLPPASLMARDHSLKSMESLPPSPRPVSVRIHTHAHSVGSVSLENSDRHTCKWLESSASFKPYSLTVAANTNFTGCHFQTQPAHPKPLRPASPVPSHGNKKDSCSRVPALSLCPLTSSGASPCGPAVCCVLPREPSIMKSFNFLSLSLLTCSWSPHTSP